MAPCGVGGPERDDEREDEKSEGAVKEKRAAVRGRGEELGVVCGEKVGERSEAGRRGGGIWSQRTLNGVFGFHHGGNWEGAEGVRKGEEERAG